jgi:hypothetical protein
MRKPLVLLAVIALATIALGQSSAAHIDASAVWQPGGDFVASAHAACDKATPSAKFSECVISQMSKAGASAAAVSFTRELYKMTGGEVGTMGGFHAVGPVDIAWVQFPINSTNGLFFVNGTPAIINAEDLKLLDEKTMQQSFQYQDLLNQFPKASVFPGDRDGKTWPNSQTGDNGGLQFVVGYPLRNGCQTCAHAGFAIFTWNFSKSGVLSGTSFMGMTPAPISAPSQGSPQQ